MANEANPTKDFLLQRKALLEAELAMVNAGLGIQSVSQVSTKPKQKTKDRPQPDIFSSSATTVPQQILAVLREHPSGLERGQVAEKVNQKYHRTLAKDGVSAYLSKLKKNGDVTFDEDTFIWRAKI